MKKNKNLSKVAEDLINIEFTPETTLGAAKKKFYKVMAKHGIKKYMKVKNGMTGDNFEWTMCHTLFSSRIQDYFMLDNLFEEPPKNVECY